MEFKCFQVSFVGTMFNSKIKTFMGVLQIDV